MLECERSLMKMKKRILILTILLLTSNLFAQQEKEFNLWGSGETFKLNPVLDGILFPSSFGLNLTSFFVNKYAESPSYSDFSFNKDDINSFDKPFMNKYNKFLDKTGDVFMITSMALPLTLAFTDNSEWLTILTMYAETLFLANGTKELLKDSLVRPRPYNYFSGAPQKDIEENDWHRSWPSGHATLSFAGAAFTTYVFAQYFPDSKWKWAVAGTSYTFALTTAVLRMCSGNHFFTDVLTGAAIGTVYGILVPWCHTLTTNSHEKNTVNTNLEPAGFSITINF